MRVDDGEGHAVPAGELSSLTAESGPLAVHDRDGIAGGECAVCKPDDGGGLATARGAGDEDVLGQLVGPQVEGPAVGDVHPESDGRRRVRRLDLLAAPLGAEPPPLQVRGAKTSIEL